MGEKETMKIEKLNYNLNTYSKTKIDKHARFGSIEQTQSVVQAKGSYETSGSMGKVDRNVSTSLRHMYANGKIGKVSKTPYAIISFGGKNKKHQVFVGAEMPPYCKIGGVATVMEDYKVMFNDDKDNRKVMIIPYYNGKIETDEKGYPTGKISVHTFPEGQKDKNGNDIGRQPFYTAENLYDNSEEDIIKKGKYHLLEKVGADEKMAFGFKTNESIALYRVKDTNHFMVFTEATAAMPKPYEERAKIGEGSGKGKKTSYSSSGGINHGWNGDPYAKFNKAVVQLLPKIQYTYDSDGKQENTKFEPATVICSDSQSAYIPHYMANEATNDNEYYNDDVHPTFVAHNLGQGYVSQSTYKEMYINLGATKEDLENIQKDEAYLKAAATGPEKEEEYFKKFFNNFRVADDSGVVSGIMVPIHYTKQGYIPVLTTVSESYAKALATNSAISPGLYNIFKEMSDKKQFQGILNAANDPNLDPRKRLGLSGFGYAIFQAKDKDGKITYITSKDLALKDLDKNEEYKNAGIKKDKDKQAALLEEKATYYDNQKELEDIQGYEKITRYSEAFTRYDKEVTDENWNKIKEAKAQNKLKFINRLSKDGETNSLLLTGLPGKEVKQIGALDLGVITTGLQDGDNIKKLEKCKLTVSWGRGDLQKGLDTTMLAWAKCAQHDKNSFLILGGELQEGEEGEKIKKVIDELSKSFIGRFVFLDGFAPGFALSMAADIASFPSRFAPCELTDLEAMHFGVTPVVTNCQGLQQKNYDPELGDIQNQTSFKTQQEFYMSHETLIKHDEDMQKAIDWLETKIGAFSLLEGNKTEGFSYKSQASLEDIYQERDKILTAYAADNHTTTEEEAEQKDTIRKLLQASYELKTSGFKDKYNALEQKAFSQAKNINRGIDISDEYKADLIKDIRKSSDYEDLVRASSDFIINSEMAMGFVRAQHSLTSSEEEQKALFKNAISLNTKLTGNKALHPTGQSTQELYKNLHINGKYTKPESGSTILKIEHFDTSIENPKVSSENKRLVDKIKNWWNGLSNTAKWGIGIGSGVAVAAAICGGIFAGIKVHQNKLAELEAATANDEDAYYDEEDEMIDE